MKPRTPRQPLTGWRGAAGYTNRLLRFLGHQRSVMRATVGRGRPTRKVLFAPKIAFGVASYRHPDPCGCPYQTFPLRNLSWPECWGEGVKRIQLEHFDALQVLHWLPEDAQQAGVLSAICVPDPASAPWRTSIRSSFQTLMQQKSSMYWPHSG